MIVVPSLTESDDREQPAVATIIIRVVAALAPYMGERVDKQGSMEQNRGANEKCPNKELAHGGPCPWEKGFKNPAYSQHEKSIRKWDSLIVAVEKDQLWVFAKIRNRLITGRKILHRSEPADV
jgi:hypothetical protein